MSAFVYLEYDVVFVGYPKWWGDMPMIMYTFLEQYDLAGKKIIKKQIKKIHKICLDIWENWW